MELIKNIAAVIGCVLSFISLITICTKSGRSFISKLFKENTKDLQSVNKQQEQDIAEIKKDLAQLVVLCSGMEQVLKQQCRNTIKNIYYKYNTLKKIPLYERKTVDVTYELYHDVFHGNSYVTLLYSEICKWDIEPSADIFELDED